MSPQTDSMEALDDKTTQASGLHTLSHEFEKEAAPHYHTLLKRALRLTRNKQDAEDLVQDTLLRAYRSWSAYEKGTNCGAWLQKILYNQFLNTRRSLKRAGDSVDYADVAEAVSFTKHSVTFVTGRPDCELRRTTIATHVSASLNALPEEFSQPIRLFLCDGLKYESIALLLGTQIGTVKSRIYRSRMTLKSALEELYLALDGATSYDVGIYGGNRSRASARARVAA